MFSFPYAVLPLLLSVLLAVKFSPYELALKKDTVATSPGRSSMQFNQVVLFGDSITQWSWSEKFGLGAAMANVYQRKMDVVNRGLAGYNTLWGLAILEKWLPKRHEDRPEIALLVIWFGANDACLPPSPQSLTIAEFKINLHTIISLVRSPKSPYYNPKTKFLLITPPPVDAPTRNNALLNSHPPRIPDRDAERTRLFAEAVKEVGKEAEVPSVDVWTAITDAASKVEEGLDKYLSDGLHLTGDGYQVVSFEVAKVIQAQLSEIHWDNLEPIFPHSLKIWNEGVLGDKYKLKKNEEKSGEV